MGVSTKVTGHSPWRDRRAIHTLGFPEDEDEVRVTAPHYAGLSPSRGSLLAAESWANPTRAAAPTSIARLPIVPPRGRVGRPGSARLSGRYRSPPGDPTRAGPRIRGAMYSVAPPQCCSSGGLRGTFRSAAPGSTTLRVVSVSVPAPSSQTEAAALSASTATPRSRCASYAAARRTASRFNLGADVSTTRTRRRPARPLSDARRSAGGPPTMQRIGS